MIALILITAFLSFMFCSVALFYARRRGLIDLAGQRHSHVEPTPRGGGIGLVMAIVLTTTSVFALADGGAWLWCVLPGMVLLAVTGFWDDHVSLGVGLRLALQLVAAASVVICGWQAGWLDSVGLALVGGVYLLALPNLYNFMDGSNGMAAWQGVFAGAVLAWLFSLSNDMSAMACSIIVASACAGFLPLNFPKAHVFMGDAGSLPLGFVFAALSLYGVASGALSIPAAVMVMAVFLVDSSLTLLMRVLKGERWYNAHRQHAYQRLIANGWRHASVAMLYLAINVLVLAPAIYQMVQYPQNAWFVLIAGLSALSICWLVLTRRFGVPAQAK